MKEIASQGAQVNLNQILNMVAPHLLQTPQQLLMERIISSTIKRIRTRSSSSFSKWKRRHTSSLVNINGSPGRGAVGTDLNAIPACYR
jgi:iron complex outermembrane receptor protein